MTFISHCAAAVTAIRMPAFFMISRMPPKSTCPFLRIRSMALPVSIGKYSVENTVTAANSSDSSTRSRYWRIEASTFFTVCICLFLPCIMPAPFPCCPVNPVHCETGMHRFPDRHCSFPAAVHACPSLPAPRHPAQGYSPRTAPRMSSGIR